MRKFEDEKPEEQVEETVTETTEEETPDMHAQFVSLLVDMGLSAEQAEAIHQMAMDMTENTQSETNKVEASRKRRPMGAGKKRKYGAKRRGRFSEESAPRRREMSTEQMERVIARQRRMLSKLRRELSELQNGPAAPAPNTAPQKNTSYEQFSVPTEGTAMDRATAIMNQYLK